MNVVRLRILLWGAVLIALAGLAFLLVRPEPSPINSSTTELPLSSIGGPFTLVDANGRPFSSSSLATSMWVTPVSLSGGFGRLVYFARFRISTAM